MSGVETPLNLSIADPDAVTWLSDSLAVMSDTIIASDINNGFVGGFTKGYRVTAYVLQVAAANMDPDPAVNIAVIGLIGGMLIWPRLRRAG